MLGIDKISLLPNEFAMSILDFVKEWGDDVDDWAIFLMDATNSAYDDLRLNDDDLRVELDRAFASTDSDELARAVLAVVRMGEDGYEEKLQSLTTSNLRYNPLIATDMHDMLIKLGCESELFDAPQVPADLEKLQSLAQQGGWVISLEEDQKASLAGLAKWALNLMTI